MTLALLALAFALAAAPTVEASEQGAGNAPPPPLKLRSKAAVSEALAPRNTAAPFREPVLGSEPDLLAPAGDPRRESSAWTCNGESSLCYDPDSRRIVYKPARALMPDLPGLRRENISVKRDRITFKYSF